MRDINLKIALLVVLFVVSFHGNASAIEFKDIPAVGLAFLTNLSMHETGHYIIANQSGAEGNTLNFFTRDRNSFFLGLSTVTKIDDRAKPSYHFAGEVAAGYTFEFALRRFRENDTTYNHALLFFSMTDFLWYTTYAFYVAPYKNDKFDPIGIVNTTGISRDKIFLVALTHTSLNAIRAYTGQDRFIPFYMLDRHFIGFGVKVPF
ncbi:MAG: hypothetical protein HZA12_02685 [Nitrospirae bacterium]|nr:hypothetical protein [Nitrospirota bacterium]